MSLLCFPRHSWSKRKEEVALGGGAKEHLIGLSPFNRLTPLERIGGLTFDVPRDLLEFYSGFVRLGYRVFVVIDDKSRKLSDRAAAHVSGEINPAS